MKVAYLFDSGLHMCVFETPDGAAEEAVKLLDSYSDKQPCRKDLLSNVGGLRLQEVDSFNKESISRFLSAVKVGGRLILSAHLTEAESTLTVKIEKLAVIKEE